MVRRLKGGDPYIFGRGGEEATALAAARIFFEVVPGVSSIVAAPNYAGIPLTHRDHCSSFTVMTGHEDSSKPETDRKSTRLNSSHANISYAVFCLKKKKKQPYKHKKPSLHIISSIAST